jgi:tetratricopeptide (TPR) repeat protein
MTPRRFPAPRAALAGAALAAAGACSHPAPDISPAPEATGEATAIEATSLLGRPLARPPLEPDRRRQLESDLAEAVALYGSPPASEEGFVWVGRRLAYLGRYNDAVETFSAGLRANPDSFRLLRHRGHRLLTLRRLDAALADLTRAAALIEGVPDEVEPDGAPNRFNVPRSTTHSNIWYHLGLARYLRGDWRGAADAYGRGMEFAAVNDDMRCATSYWLYLSLQRDGRGDEAAAILEPVHEEMEILENDAYHALLLLYRGRREPEALLAGLDEDGVDFATLGYGVAAWRRARGDDEGARRLLTRVVAGGAWPAFGHLAAEADLARDARAAG